ARGKIIAHAAAPVPGVRTARPEIPEGVSQILERMLAKSPNDRLATPAAVASALAPYCAGSNLAQLLHPAGLEAPPRTPSADPSQPTTRVEQQSARAGRRRGRAIAIGVLFALLALGGGLSAAIRLWTSPATDQVAIEPSPQTPAPDGPITVPLAPVAEPT